MPVTVTATQGGGAANGMLLRVFVLTGAAATQDGATLSNIEANTTDASEDLVTTQTGSRAYGACDHGSSGEAATGKTGTTVVDDVSDGTNTQRYVTFKSTAATGTPGTTNFGFTTTGSVTGPWAIAEIKTSGTLAEDASGSAAVASTTSATTVTTPSFTPPAGSLLVAMVATNGGVTAVTMTVSDTGGGYSWSEKIKWNAAGDNYAGVWLAQVPAGGGTATANAGLASSTGTAPTAAGNAATAALYAGTATAISGSWADTSNATGGTQGTYATWSDSGAGSSAVLELAAFGAQAAVPAGSTVNSVTCVIRHGETPVSQIASVTAQAYPGGSPSGSPQALTKADAVHDDTVTFAGLTYADLADLRVRLTVTRT